MAYRRPDSFDGLGFHHGRDAPLYGAQWVTEPPDIPGSRNPYPGERTPQHGDEAAGEHGGLKPAWDATQPGPPPAGGKGSLPESAVNREQLSRFAGFGIGLVSLFTENVLAHPCIVFRRQCQVNYHARCLHLTPFTSVGVMYAITKAQGVKSLWKGMGSTFIVHGISLGAEGIISEFTPLPRELPHRWSWKQLAGHLLLKGLTAIVALPFYCASLIETVQSDIVRDESSSGLLDCVREGLTRVLGVGAPHSRRLLPVSSLLAPAALHAVLRYAVAASVQRAALWVYQRGKRQQDSNRSNMAADGSDRPKMASASDPLESYFPELAAAWLGSLVADVLLFPLETALHRLALQGTRTIIDATDGASSILASSSAASPLVLPVNTQYDGFKDCLHAITRKEGNVGFYRGFGALVTQYAIHGALLAAARTLLRLLLQEGAKLS